MIATDENLSAVAWLEGTNELRASFSDGRGVEWTPTITVKPSHPAPAFDAALCVDQQVAVFAWRDRRHAVPQSIASTPFVRTYDASSGLLSAEVQLLNGLPAANVTTERPIAAAVRVGSTLRVHVLVHHAVFPAPPTNMFGGPVATDSLLRLYTSNDGGHTFPIARDVAHLPLTAILWDLRVEAEGDDVHVFWTDDRSSWQDYEVYHQRSSDGGLTFDFPVEHRLTTHAAIQAFDVDVAGSVIALAVNDTAHDPLSGTVYWDRIDTLVSVDRGTTFTPQTTLPGASATDYAFAWPSVAISSSGAAIDVAWQSGGGWTTQPDVDWSRSVDAGAHWSSEALLTANGGHYPRLRADPSGRARMTLSWAQTDGWRVAASLDDGASWQPPVEFSGDTFTTGGVGHIPACWNSRYQNFVSTWLTAAAGVTTVWSGGARPQTITPIGFQVGPASPHVACERFDDGNSIAFVLASLTPGSFALPFGDGRELGLAPDALFAATANLAVSGVLAAPLDAQGDGATAALAGAVLPAGLQFSLVGVSFDLATLRFGDISDVVTVQL
ncbi:MAG: hypothetical protein EPO68_02845 [Planctomycetota bacterium]|nr:MAG: hypothetical protein EPO68_02845 [Planctomycetota bacterium]